MRLPGILLLACLVVVPLRAQSHSCPEPSHLATIEADGTVSQGSIDALRAAYRRGASLRVGWELDMDDDGSPEVTHWADASFLSELGGVVTAQVAQIERQIPRRGQARIDFAEGPQRWSGLLSSDGTLLGRYSDGAPRRDRVRASWCLAGGVPRLACVDRWRLAYHHDPDGGRISGDKELLLDAVRRGRPIRVSWGSRSARDPTISVEHVAEPVFVTSTGGELFAQLPEHIAQRAYADPEAARFETPSVMWRGLMGTTGVFDAVWVDRATGEEVRRVPQRAQVAWFVYGPAPSCETEPPVPLAVPGGVRADDR